MNNLINQLSNQLNNILNVTEPMAIAANDVEDENDGEEEDNDEAVEEAGNEAVPPSQTNQSFNVQMVGQFSMKEVDDINEIVNMGFDYYEVIQIYTACGKNKEDAITLLLGN